MIRRTDAVINHCIAKTIHGQCYIRTVHVGRLVTVSLIENLEVASSQGSPVL